MSGERSAVVSQAMAPGRNSSSPARGAYGGAAGGGVVQEVDGVALAPAGEVEGEQHAQPGAGGEAAFERPAATSEGIEGGGSRGNGPDRVGCDEARLAVLVLDEPGDPEEGEQVAGVAHGRERRGEEDVRDGRGLPDPGESGEGGGLAHRSIPSGMKPSSGCSTQSSNLASRWRKRSSTVPVGPLRCFATMTWATPWG